MTAPSFSIYVHLPYCLRRCAYCDFNAYAAARLPESDYLGAVLAEVAFHAQQQAWEGRKVSSLFFGGGTPSLFSAASISELIDTFDRLFGLEAGAEVSLEANPGTLEGGGEEKLREFRVAGVNRLSIGCQSFNPRHLSTLGRIHSASDARNAVAASRRAGFSNLSCDLIFAIPGQSLSEWQQDLSELADLAPEHVSAYNLSYEEGTALSRLEQRRSITAVAEEAELDMWITARETFAAAGFEHYEISNFARPGYRCRHNSAYWTWGDYLGLGAGAHGFLAGPGHQDDNGDNHSAGSSLKPRWGMRFKNIDRPEDYMSAKRGGWCEHSEVLDRTVAIEEYLMTGLRMIQGIDESDFRRRFGGGLASLCSSFETLRAEELLVHRHGKVALSAAALNIADSVILELASSCN